MCEIDERADTAIVNQIVDELAEGSGRPASADPSSPTVNEGLPTLKERRKEAQVKGWEKFWEDRFPALLDDGLRFAGKRAAIGAVLAFTDFGMQWRTVLTSIRNLGRGLFG